MFNSPSSVANLMHLGKRSAWHDLDQGRPNYLLAWAFFISSVGLFLYRQVSVAAKTPLALTDGLVYINRYYQGAGTMRIDVAGVRRGRANTKVPA